MRKEDIVVVIPIYRLPLTAFEEKSLRQCVKVLSDYSLIVVKPVSLDISRLLVEYPMLKEECFAENCFNSLRAYNKLVLDEDFYRRFLSYEYMLVYQLDAYVFRDELLEWAKQDYDYIGAPWLPEHPERKMVNRKSVLLKRMFYRFIDSPKLKRWKYFKYGVGNGGFSLRRISKMIKITHAYKHKIDCLLDDKMPFYPEDVLLFVEIRKRGYRLKIPDCTKALQFSMEVSAEWAYNCNKQQLPFGCHAWCHADNYPFWSRFIEVN
ncbi:DUF5672 family protein [uncultured Bacteroides sp.]|uniref:DUF5672 family protein n=1 Tax=uncultured Bacteroides sp. TaxID=162156 RepID=UPI0025E2E688|nr:DUF5672 family protein [uncultured Bacteroides sp.]